jgi:hypothetical protein
MTRLALTPPKCLSLKTLTAAPNQSAKAAPVIPPADPDAWLRQAASTAEFANFSGDTSPYLRIHEHDFVAFFGKFWNICMYHIGTFSTKISPSSFECHDFPACVSVLRVIVSFVRSILPAIRPRGILKQCVAAEWQIHRKSF